MKFTFGIIPIGSTDIFNLQPGCHDLAVYFRSNIASLDTGGNCIRVFSGLGCTGESTEFSGAHNELDDWSDQIESWRGCAFSSGGTYSVSQERRVTFYCIPNFSGIYVSYKKHLFQGYVAHS